MTKSEIKNIYHSNINHYKEVCSAGKETLESVLKKKKIDLLHVSARVKSFESFYEKILRKKYPDPYRQIEDICGLRIICFYSNDLEKIDRIIHDTFDLRDFIDKSEIQDPDRFGYRSKHYIVRLPPSIKVSATESFKLEIQVRTILMHAWAHIQGKLEYKKEEHIPKKFKRKLHQLSAILELADGQFQSLKTEKDELRKVLTTGDYNFSDSTELNIDTFMSFLDTHFPNRGKSYRYSKLLMRDLLERKIGFKEILEAYGNVAAYLADVETGALAKLRRDEILKIILYAGNRSILNYMSDDQIIKDNLKMIEKWTR